ncbi:MULTISPECIES: hypothetical protein [Herbiconiux]|jgi:hypothetical protein|uniref:Uncharacterized protein n=1 Tax=Herbiconiux flava TaxID=881268 RepID=A0A852STM8_9MICO|nr:MULTISPECIES: hypothetical protein [Herbiconiux]NQX34471.1 hypothetical protein [Herbiconiux sp. VKM Ac-2851]NYD72093.1 hypothetical protein [Herbiconiux flava]GLK17943.1 hypothetical protein GCM10017602_24250 [Herbiconiux flava]
MNETTATAGIDNVLPFVRPEQLVHPDLVGYVKRRFSFLDPEHAARFDDAPDAA